MYPGFEPVSSRTRTRDQIDLTGPAAAAGAAPASRTPNSPVGAGSLGRELETRSR